MDRFGVFGRQLEDTEGTVVLWSSEEETKETNRLKNGSWGRLGGTDRNRNKASRAGSASRERAERQRRRDL